MRTITNLFSSPSTETEDNKDSEQVEEKKVEPSKINIFKGKKNNSVAIYDKTITQEIVKASTEDTSVDNKIDIIPIELLNSIIFEKLLFSQILENEADKRV